MLVVHMMMRITAGSRLWLTSRHIMTNLRNFLVFLWNLVLNRGGHLFLSQEILVWKVAELHSSIYCSSFDLVADNIVLTQK